MLLAGTEPECSAPQYVSLSSTPAGIAGEDLNLDGKRDLIVTLPDDNKAAILFGLGDGRFSASQGIAVGARPTSVAIQDADGDGRADILVSNQGDDTASVILNHFDPSRVYQYSATAIDPDDDPVTYDIVTGPDGMLIDPTTGHITWAPTSDQVGIHSVILRPRMIVEERPRNRSKSRFPRRRATPRPSGRACRPRRSRATTCFTTTLMLVTSTRIPCAIAWSMHRLVRRSIHSAATSNGILAVSHWR